MTNLMNDESKTFRQRCYHYEHDWRSFWPSSRLDVSLIRYFHHSRKRNWKIRYSDSVLAETLTAKSLASSSPLHVRKLITRCGRNQNRRTLSFSWVRFEHKFRKISTAHTTKAPTWKIEIYVSFYSIYRVWYLKFAFLLFCDIKIWSRWDQLEQAN